MAVTRLLQTPLSRGEATRQALMKAAEKLYADKGEGHVTIREIVESAGQKNESALQYHFKNLKGLIAAIHEFRGQQINEARRLCQAQLSDQNREPTLREIAQLMVEPLFFLGRENAEFRRYIRAFSLSFASKEERGRPLFRESSKEADEQLANLLRQVLPHLNSEGFSRRLNSVVRFVSVSMHAHAHQPNAFRGKTSDLFFNHLVDALVGLLSAKESAITQVLSREVADFEGRSMD